MYFIDLSPIWGVKGKLASFPSASVVSRLADPGWALDSSGMNGIVRYSGAQTSVSGPLKRIARSKKIRLEAQLPH